MTIRHLIVAVMAAILLSFSVPAQADRPNIVFILADDLGYGDVKCFGGDRCRIDTPHFDRLAREGMRFTSAYSICSVCVPSRIAMMTGRYPWRFGYRGPGGPWGFIGMQLPPGQHTLGTMMRSAGYRTSYIGKWHLGTLMHTTDGKNQTIGNVDYTKPMKIGPPQFGFDHSFILPGSLDMYPYVFARNNEWLGPVTKNRGWSAFNRIGPTADDFEDYKVLGAFCDEADRFIAQCCDSTDGQAPFFLFLGLTSPHTPLSPTKEFEGKSPIGVYGDFVMETDHCIGRVLKALEANGVLENTLVIATSDHGAASYAGRNRVATAGQLEELEEEGHYASGPFRGYKFSVYEGGFRVPYVARWPGVVKPGTTCDGTIGLHDLMGTMADITGVTLNERQGPDSYSILPLLKDADAQSPRDVVILQGTLGMAIRSGDWKLAFCPGSGSKDQWLIEPGHDRSWQDALKSFGRNPRNHDELLQPAFVQLFNIVDDPGETTDLSAKYPEKIKELTDLFHAQVRAGRTTPGEKLSNDRGDIGPFRAVPKYVWGK
jgi:arylsulfatase A-like enzyme